MTHLEKRDRRAATQAGSIGLADLRTRATKTMITNRLAALAEQGLIAGGNFLLTLGLARHYEPIYLAGFGVGLYYALILQGLYRACFVTPIALLDERSFRSRARELVAQHIVVSAVALGVTVLFAVVFVQAHASPLTTFSAFSACVCMILSFSLDFDRIFLLRSGYRRLPGAFALFYAVLVLTLLLAGWMNALSANHMLGALGAFGAARMVWCSWGICAPDFRRTGTLLRINLRRNFGWGALANLATNGYTSVPLFALSALAPPLSAAAFVAMRSLVQPLQLVLRSFDVVDKLAFSSIERTDVHAQGRHIRSVLLLYAGLSAGYTAAAAFFGDFVLQQLYGTRYAGFHDLLTLWACITSLSCCTAPLETTVYRMGRLKSYALVQLGACVAAVALAVPLIGEFADVGAASIGLLGTVVALAGAAYLSAGLLFPAKPGARPALLADPLEANRL